MRRLLFALLLCLPGVAYAEDATPGSIHKTPGPLVYCWVTTTQPTEANITAWPISCDTTGAIRITAGLNPLLVTGTTGVGGFDADVVNQMTVQNASYSASNAMGGLQTISVFRNVVNPAGILNYIQIMSKGGSTVAMTVYAYDTNPTAVGSYACTDKTAFADDPGVVGFRVPGFPIVLTPAVSQGSTQSFSSVPVVTSVKNQDGTPTTNLYFCVVANGTVTPASTSDLLLKIGISQD